MPLNFNKAVELARRSEVNLKVAGYKVGFAAHSFILSYIQEKFGEKIAEEYRRTAESYEPFTIWILEGLKKVGLLPKKYGEIAEKIAEKNGKIYRLLVIKGFGTKFPEIERVFPAKIHELPLDEQIKTIEKIENNLRKILTPQMLVYMKKSINRDIKIKKTGIIPISWEKVNKKGYLGGLNLGRLRKNLGVINNWQNRIRLRYR